MDYGVFDSLIDAVFVIDSEKKIKYCNNSAAAMCNSSVRRLSRGTFMYDVVQFSEAKLFCMPKGDWGQSEATPFTEIDFTLVAGGKTGKVQVAIQPFQDSSEPRWVVMVHDVTLEETLHTKYRGELEAKEEYIDQLRKAQAQLEAYSKNLEQMVEERTKEVQDANKMLNAIMNSLGQGFLVFDATGVCGRVYTRACESILESVPQGRKVSEVLRLSTDELMPFVQWMGAAFSESLPFETMKDLAPQVYKHTAGRYVTLDYYPIRNEQEKITNMVMVATDRTAERSAALALEKERQHAQMIVKAARSRDQFQSFLSSFKQTVDECQKLLDQAYKTKTLDHAQAFRLLHTLEGEAGAFAALDLRNQSRLCQEHLGPLSVAQGNVDKDDLKPFAESLQGLKDAYTKFLEDNRVIFDALGFGGEKLMEVSAVKLNNYLNKLLARKVPPELAEEFSNDFLCVSLKKSLEHYDTVAQLVAEKLGKKLNPTIYEGDVRIEPKRFETMISTLVHVFRNAVDHGIEPSEEREFTGKPAAGQLILRLKQEARAKVAWLIMEIEDDGGGINPNAIRKKFAQKFPQVDISKMDDTAVQQLIFYPGFSSRDAVGDFSGRGIGMDAVRNEVEKMGGTTRVESEIGRGTRLIIEVPLRESSISLAVGA